MDTLSHTHSQNNNLTREGVGRLQLPRENVLDCLIFPKEGVMLETVSSSGRSRGKASVPQQEGTGRGKFSWK